MTQGSNSISVETVPFTSSERRTTLLKYLPLFAIFLVSACNTPEVSVSPTEEPKTVPSTETNAKEKMTASVTIITERTWDNGTAHKYSEPGLHLGSGIVLTNSLAISKTANPAVIRYERPDGSTTTVPTTVLKKGPPGVYSLVLLKAAGPLPLPAAEFADKLPGLEDKVRTKSCDALVSTVELKYGERRFRIFLKKGEGCDCDMGEAVYDQQGHVIGVCSADRLAPYWQPEGYDDTSYGVISSEVVAERLGLSTSTH